MNHTIFIRFTNNKIDFNTDTTTAHTVLNTLLQNQPAAITPPSGNAPTFCVFPHHITWITIDPPLPSNE